MPTITRSFNPPGGSVQIPGYGAVVTNTSAFTVNVNGSDLTAGSQQTIGGGIGSIVVNTATASASVSVNYTAAPVAALPADIQAAADLRYSRGRNSLPVPSVPGPSNTIGTDTNVQGTYRWFVEVPFEGYDPIVSLRGFYRISPNVLGTLAEMPLPNAITQKLCLEVPVAQIVATGGSGTTVTTTDLGTLVANEFVQAVMPYTLTVLSAAAAGLGQVRDVTANGTGSFTVATWGNSYVPAAGDILVLCRRVPVTFGGNRVVTVSPGVEVFSDQVGTSVSRLTAPLAPGVWVRMTYGKNSGESYATGYNANPKLGEGGSQGTTLVFDFCDSGNLDITTFMISGPYIGSFEIKPLDSRIAVAVWGDSRALGYYDMGATDSVRPRGAYARAANSAGVGLLLLANSSLTGYRAVPATRRSNSTRSMKRGCKRAIYTYGTNDFSNGRTLVQMQADALSWANDMVAQGIEPWIEVIPPQSSSSNGFRDVAGQTANASDATIRQPYNAWVRTLPAPFKGMVDEATVTESGLTGKWLAPEGALLVGPVAGTASATAASTSAYATLTDSGVAMTPNLYQYKVLRIVAGTGSGQTRGIVSNTATVFTIGRAWSVTPDSTSTWEVLDSYTEDGTHETKRSHDLKMTQILASGLYNP